jgi:hypothetical protein
MPRWPDSRMLLQVPFTRKKDVDDLTLLKSDKWEKLMEGTAREFQVRSFSSPPMFIRAVG